MSDKETVALLFSGENAEGVARLLMIGCAVAMARDELTDPMYRRSITELLDSVAAIARDVPETTILTTMEALNELAVPDDKPRLDQFVANIRATNDRIRKAGT